MKHTLVKHLFTLIALIALAAAVFLGWKLYQKELEYKKGQEQLDQIYTLMEEARKTPPEPSKGAEEPSKEEKETAARLAQYKALHEENTDMTGWIRIPGTKVDYPVMYTPQNPEFYLDHGFDKTPSAYGMIFIDGECSPETDPSLLIYGHHMKNGSMFAEIENYDDPAFWKDHPMIRFDTLENLGTYEVAGAFKQPAARLDDSFKTMLLARTEEDFSRLCSFMEANCFYDTGVKLSWGDRLIILTTCEYTQADGRFFVVARQT